MTGRRSRLPRLTRLVPLVLAGIAGGVPATSVAADWWEAFGHAGLTAAVEQGLAEHPDPRVMLARIRAAEAGVDAARAGGQPDAAAQAGYRFGREQSMMTGGVADDIDPLMASARLAWELDVFGRIGADVGAAEARLAARDAEADAVRLALAHDLVRVYLESAVLAEEVTWWERQVDDARALRDRAERRVGAGLDDPSVLRRAEAMVQQGEHRLMEVEIRRTQTAARLRALLGGRDPAVAPASLAGFTLPPPPDLAGADVHLRRPDVVRAYAAWQAAQGEATGAARDRWPSLALVVSAAGEGDDPGTMNEWSAWAGPVVSVPLWQPRRGARAAGARAGADAAEAELAAVSLRAVREIDAAWADREAAEAMTAHMAARSEALAAEAASAARRQAAGLIDEALWREARIAHAEAARAHAAWTAAALRNHATLIAALGGMDD